MIRRRKQKRRIVAALSDIHSGYRLGLLNPDTVLVRAKPKGGDEDWTPDLTTTQVELWKVYLKNIKEIKRFAGRDEIIAIHGGDATQGSRYNARIEGVTDEDERTIAVANLMPFMSFLNVQKMRLVTGTESHVPDSAEARIARTLREESGKDVQCLHHARTAIDGVTLDIAHHGPFPGSRDWLHGNVATYYLRDRIYKDRRGGIEPATVYLRGHFHEWVHVTLNDCWEGVDRTHHLIVLPSFSGLTHFARKVTKSTPYLTTGMAAFEIIDGELARIKPVKQTWDLRCEEEL